MDTFVRYTPIAIVALISIIITLFFYFKIDSEVKASFLLQLALEEQQGKKEKQIEVIENVAKKMRDEIIKYGLSSMILNNFYAGI